MNRFRKIETALSAFLRKRMAWFVRNDEAEATLARLRALSGKGDSRRGQWNREEIYAERLQRRIRP